MHYTFHCVFPLGTFHVSFSFYWLYLKAGAAQSSNASLFRIRSTVVQVNVQAVTAKNEEQHILSNIIYVVFQNITLFFDVFFETGVFERLTNWLKSTCSGLCFFW